MTDPLATARPQSAAVPGSVEATDLPGIDGSAVSAWFAEHVAGFETPLRFELIPGGHSNLTFTVTDAAGRRGVLRRPPLGHLLPTAHDMSREHRIIAAMGHAGVPAPPVLGLCADTAVTGAPFFVMEFVPGYVLRDEPDAESALTPADRGAVSEHLVDTLVAIHAVDPDGAGLGDLGRRDGYIARQLRRWYAQYQAARDDQGGPDVRQIDRVHDRLAAAIPDQQHAGVVHGDYRLDNTIVSSSGTIEAVLDWELCTLGDTMADLGQLLVYWIEPGGTPLLGGAATTAPGFATRAQLAGRYEQASGRSLEHLDFYVAFAYWKLACILEGVYTRYAAGSMGEDGVDFEGYPAIIRYLADEAAGAVAGYGQVS